MSFHTEELLEPCFKVRMESPAHVLKPKWLISSQYRGWVELRILNHHLNEHDVESLIASLRNTIALSKQVVNPIPQTVLDDFHEQKPLLFIASEAKEEEVTRIVAEAEHRVLGWLKTHSCKSATQIYHELSDAKMPISRELIRMVLDRLYEAGKVQRTGHGKRGRNGCFRYSISTSDEPEKC